MPETGSCLRLNQLLDIGSLPDSSGSAGRSIRQPVWLPVAVLEFRFESCSRARIVVNEVWRVWALIWGVAKRLPFMYMNREFILR